jgi:hypothetical protein
MSLPKEGRVFQGRHSDYKFILNIQTSGDPNPWRDKVPKNIDINIFKNKI